MCAFRSVQGGWAGVGQGGRARALLVASGGGYGCLGLGRVPAAQFLKLE